MPKDDKSVQPDAVPVEGTESPEVETPEVETPPQPQPLTAEQEARIQQIISEQTESARREIQSAKDRGKAEVVAAQRRAGLAEGTLAGYDRGLGQLDPEQAELIRLRAKDTGRLQADAMDAQRREGEVFYQQFRDSATRFVTTMGVDPNDKRIDWGQDAQNAWDAKARIEASVATILADDRKVADDKRSQESKDLEARLRKDLGIDSVDTSSSPSAGSVKRKDILKRYGEGDPSVSRKAYEEALKQQ